MEPSKEGEGRDLLAALTTSLTRQQWDTARRILAGEDPTLTKELQQLLHEPWGETTLAGGNSRPPATSWESRTA